MVLGALPSLAGQRKPLLSPHSTETHQIPDSTIVRNFPGLFPSLLLMKNTEMKVSPISLFSKEATKGDSHSTMEPSELPLSLSDTLEPCRGQSFYYRMHFRESWSAEL